MCVRIAELPSVRTVGGKEKKRNNPESDENEYEGRSWKRKGKRGRKSGVRDS